LAKAEEVAGSELAAIFYAGDFVNVADRASEWFDHAGGAAFFPVFQGRARVRLAGHDWCGAPLLQRLPIYPTIGNHEVMGRRCFAALRDRHQFPWPRGVAEAAYHRTHPDRSHPDRSRE